MQISEVFFQNSFQNDAKSILNQSILRKNREYCMHMRVFKKNPLDLCSGSKEQAA